MSFDAYLIWIAQAKKRKVGAVFIVDQNAYYSIKVYIRFTYFQEIH